MKKGASVSKAKGTYCSFLAAISQDFGPGILVLIDIALLVIPHPHISDYYIAENTLNCLKKD